ncbi:MAG: hypothetical protein EPO23_00310 [Xanthobacteraceae bacterium]|nr:MAG: hypothetical protein EPO23_00310 [Xanthobacteraceae bacterium]
MSVIPINPAGLVRLPLARICDGLALLAIAVLGLVVLMTFRDYGLGWDDYTHSEYADQLIDLYRSGLRDSHAFAFANLFMYGGGFDIAAALLQKILPLGIFETRRLLGGAVGIIGIVVTWRLARRTGGPVAGVAALLVLALCPIYYGHMFMNPKDAPFAVAMAVLLLGLARLAEEYPSPSPRTVLLVGFGAGIALGSRVLGGLAFIYALIGFAPLLVDELRCFGARESARRFLRMTWMLVPGLLFGYLVMGLAWPWGVLDPLNPIKAVGYFSQFFEKPWKELFDGALIAVPDMPSSYLPTLFALQLPEVTIVLTLAGAAGALLLQTRRAVPARRRAVLMTLVAAALLPLIIAMVKRPALYNGVRHFVFVIPPMAVLAGLAFGWLVRWTARLGRTPAFAAIAVFVFGLALPLDEMVKLHPYQYTHFNFVSGGVRAADNRYMLDYWGLAFKQASEQLRERIAANGETAPPGRAWKVAVCGPQRPAQVALGPGFTIGWDSAGADFAMTLDEFYCRKLTAPVVVEIKRDGVVFARVYDIRGRSISTLLAIPAPQ